jgi:hypothetical protein
MAADWLTLADVAELHRVSVRTVQRWTHQGLRTTRIGRRQVTRVEWLDEFLLGQAEDREFEHARRQVARLFGRTGPPRWLTGMRLVLIASIAIAVGEEIADAWMEPWQPFGLELDSLAAIVTAVALVLIGERLLLDRLSRQVGRRAFARIRAARAREAADEAIAEPAEPLADHEPL